MREHLSDSAFAGSFMHAHGRDDLRILQMVHANQRDARADSPDGLSDTKRALMLHADAYDRLIALTRSQADDLVSDELVSGDSIEVISNSITPAELTDDERRDRHRGVVIARLAPLKRIGHAIRAAANAGPARLDVYGTGPEEALLEREIAACGAADRVRLRGYLPRARTELATASFSLLTSRSEGQGLVILESMSAGCIPIAYDISYGPRDLIDDGVNGFLVPAGDVEALSDAISRVISLDEDALTRMRTAARRTAAAYEESAIVDQWMRAIAAAARRPRVSPAALKARLISAAPVDAGVEFGIEVAGLDETRAPAAWAKIAWVGRKKESFSRAAAAADSDGRRVTAIIPASAEFGSSGFLDAFVDVREAAGAYTRVRVASPDLTSPVRTADGTREAYAKKHGNLSLRPVSESAAAPGS